MNICYGCKANLTKEEMLRHPYTHCKLAKAYPQTWRNILNDIEKKAPQEVKKNIWQNYVLQGSTYCKCQRICHKDKRIDKCKLHNNWLNTTVILKNLLKEL